MRDILSEIVEHKKQELLARKTAAQSSPRRSDGRKPGRFLAALSGSGIKLIAEVKPKSPSAGQLNQNNLEQILHAYGKLAQALSVLTDEKYFAGNLELLRTAAAKTGLPALCKDFFIDECQIAEADEAGADAILLIVKILDDETLARLHQLALHRGLTPVVEIQNQAELTRALPLNPQVLLINNRDLTTFAIDFDTTRKLAPQIPDSVLVVSASGIDTRADIEALLPYAQRFLVGSSIMRSENPESKLQELLAL